MANEKRLIDANAFAECLERMTKTAYPNLFPGLLEAIDYAKDFPPVDAVEVVRCKNCKWVEKAKSYEAYCNHWKSGLYADVKDDDFCSYGERRADE